VTSEVPDPMDDSTPEWANDLPPFGQLVAGLAGLDDEDDPASPAADLEEIVLTLAIELEVREAEGGRPRLTGSTPTQWTETTVMPAFHRMSMRITRADHA
jgi:hypothetical protein